MNKFNPKTLNDSAANNSVAFLFRFSVWVLIALVFVIQSFGAMAAEWPVRPFVLLNSNELAAIRTEVSHPGWKRDAFLLGNAPDFVGSGHAIKPNADLWTCCSLVKGCNGLVWASFSGTATGTDETNWSDLMFFTTGPDNINLLAWRAVIFHLSAQ